MILHWLRTDTDNQELKKGNNLTDDENDALIDKANELQHAENVWMKKYVGTESVWTIDLVMLLEYILRGDEHTLHQHRYDPSAFSYAAASYLFCSKQFEVDDTYSHFGYYRDAFSVDKVRVKKLFDTVHAMDHPPLLEKHITMNVLVDIVSRKGCVAIVLLDNRVLLRREENTIEGGEDDTTNPISSIEYSGHYCLICGISTDEKDISYAKINTVEDQEDDHNYCIVMKNPGLWKTLQFVTPTRFERAWRSKGTDEDVIILSQQELCTSVR